MRKTGILLIILLILPLSNSHGEGSIKIGTDDWSPYEYEKDGRVEGMCTEIISEIFKEMNISVSENRIYPWTRAEILLAKGGVDAIYSASKSVKRQMVAFYPSEPIVVSKWVFFIRKEDEGKLRYRTFEDLDEKLIGVVRDYAYTPDFLRFLKKVKNFETASNDRALFKLLTKRRFDYIVCEYAVGKAIIKQMGLNNDIVDLKNSLKETGLYIIFSKKTVDKDLVDKFSTVLKNFKRTEKYKNITEKYF